MKPRAGRERGDMPSAQVTPPFLRGFMEGRVGRNWPIKKQCSEKAKSLVGEKRITNGST